MFPVAFSLKARLDKYSREHAIVRLYTTVLPLVPQSMRSNWSTQNCPVHQSVNSLNISRRETFTSYDHFIELFLFLTIYQEKVREQFRTLQRQSFRTVAIGSSCSEPEFLFLADRWNPVWSSIVVAHPLQSVISCPCWDDFFLLTTGFLTSKISH